MAGTYQELQKKGNKVFHGEYCLYHYGCSTAFDCGAIRCIWVTTHSGNEQLTEARVVYASGEEAEWSTKWIDAYMAQFGCAVSMDGKYVFAQTWEYGLICLDARTGKVIWRTKSKRGITNIFVNENTILCHQHEHALQLLDIHTGEVLLEKRPATVWGFTALDHRHIVCQVTARRWEIIDPRSLETVASFSHKSFADGHEDYCINQIELMQDGIIKVHGFKNVWDNSVKPPRMLPNLEFEHYVKVEVLK